MAVVEPPRQPPKSHSLAGNFLTCEDQTPGELDVTVFKNLSNELKRCQVKSSLCFWN